MLASSERSRNRRAGAVGQCLSALRVGTPAVFQVKQDGELGMCQLLRSSHVVDVRQLFSESGVSYLALTVRLGCARGEADLGEVGSLTEPVHLPIRCDQAPINRFVGGGGLYPLTPLR